MKTKFLILTVAVVLALGIFSIPAYASPSVGRDGLTSEQRAEIALQVERVKKSNDDKGIISAPTEETVDKFQKYAEIGTAVGKGLVSTAKELGVAVNEFAASDVGHLTMFLIVWNYFGHEMVHVVVGSILFITLLSFWFYGFRRWCIIEKVTKTPVPGEWFLKKEVQYRDRNGDAVGGFMFILAIIVIACSIITFT